MTQDTRTCVTWSHGIIEPFNDRQYYISMHVHVSQHLVASVSNFSWRGMPPDPLVLVCYHTLEYPPSRKKSSINPLYTHKHWMYISLWLDNPCPYYSWQCKHGSKNANLGTFVLIKILGIKVSSLAQKCVDIAVRYSVTLDWIHRKYHRSRFLVYAKLYQHKYTTVIHSK